LWQGFRAEDLASPQGFRSDPERVWGWYRWRREVVAAAAPNAGHRALAALERALGSVTLVTQNVDDLHERGGSHNVVHLHGRIMGSRCFADCGRETPEDPAAPVPRCVCGSMLRPDVVWFGEMLPAETLEDARNAAEGCDACLVVGTSGLVHPAAGLPFVAKRSGAVMIEVNPEETPLSPACDLILRGPAAELLPGFFAGLGFSTEPPSSGGV
jgi:NAD-dependent deacetylase